MNNRAIPPGRYGIFGASAAIRKAIADIEKAADHRLDVLLVGETGTGKELFANAYALRAKLGLSAFDCTRLTDTHGQSDLHGHVKGAYTGAETDRQGIIQRSDGGVLFLDELDKAPTAELPKLLRVLESKEVEPLGSDKKPKKVSLHLVCAVSPRIAELRDNGRFPEDLYYRIGDRRINLPPLRARREDIPILVVHFLGKYAPQKTLTETALDRLGDFSWPGNVRQLRNFVKGHLAIVEADEIDQPLVAQELADFVRRHGYEDSCEATSVEEQLVDLIGRMDDDAAAAWIDFRSKDAGAIKMLASAVAEDCRRRAETQGQEAFQLARDRYGLKNIGNAPVNRLSPLAAAVRELLPGKRNRHGK